MSENYEQGELFGPQPAAFSRALEAKLHGIIALLEVLSAEEERGPRIILIAEALRILGLGKEVPVPEGLDALAKRLRGVTQ